MKSFIYLLIDPIDYEIRYVGKSNNPKARLAQHIYGYKPHANKKNKWIDALRKQKLKPILVIVCGCDSDNVWYWESFFFNMCESVNLTNDKLYNEKVRFKK